MLERFKRKVMSTHYTIDVVMTSANGVDVYYTNNQTINSTDILKESTDTLNRIRAQFDILLILINDDFGKRNTIHDKPNSPQNPLKTVINLIG